VEVFDSSVERLQQLRRQGVKTAIVSSSKNCLPVLQAAGLTELFDVRVDGVVSAQRGLKGKPDPDIFVEAARELGVTVDRAAVVEDALSGVMAGRRGGFKLVIGVDRVGQAQALLDSGAHVVMQDLQELSVTDTQQLPSALEAYGEIETLIRQRRPALFLDYDGTLTPIVERPELAIMADSMGDILRRLAALIPVAVISGRDLADVQRLVGLEEIYYAGSHGFDITGPRGKCQGRQLGSDFLPALDEAETALKQRLDGIPGARVERKKFAIAIHYRQVSDQDIPRVEEAVDAMGDQQPRLRKALGKKLFELQPDIDWHKGKAVRWLLKTLELERVDILPMFLGDDITDEDAFRELRDDGLGVLVADEPKPSAAHYALRDPDEVARFFAKMIDTLKEV
ncbi:MAG: trehalose-phosphatase, partial [Candidatus Competibacteraceae bacterium]|nr:trehalose-phosphatase [Candidatus Competibacteraceae bacterium]